THLDAMAARIAHELCRRVEAHRLRIDERRAKGGRLVALQPRRHIDEERERRRMRFGEAVFAEALDLLAHLAGEGFRVAARAHAVDEPGLEFVEATFAPPGCHRAPEL